MFEIPLIILRNINCDQLNEDCLSRIREENVDWKNPKVKVQELFTQTKLILFSYDYRAN